MIRPDFKQANGQATSIQIIRLLADAPVDSAESIRHRRDFHSILFVQAGQSTQEVDFENYSLAANQVMIIPKGAIYWEKETKNLEGYAILFKDEFFAEVQKELLNGFLQWSIALRKLLISIPAHQADYLVYYFELLYAEQKEALQLNQTFLLQNLMLALLNKLEGLATQLTNESSFIKKRMPFQKFITLVEAYHHQQKPLDFYTSQLNITARRLNELLKELTGQTANNFIIDRIIIEAKRELCFGEKTVKEIADALGYDNPFYFSRLFKKRTQMSPEHFRSQFAE